jgi:hypothetical protein
LAAIRAKERASGFGFRASAFGLQLQISDFRFQKWMRYKYGEMPWLQFGRAGPIMGIEFGRGIGDRGAPDALVRGAEARKPQPEARF